MGLAPISSQENLASMRAAAAGDLPSPCIIWAPGAWLGVDLSSDAVADGVRRRDGLGILSDDVEFVSNSLLDLSQEWIDLYDFVFSNGVLHHTTDPKRALSEVHRVIIPGGDAYIYVYGSGGTPRMRT